MDRSHVLILGQDLDLVRLLRTATQDSAKVSTSTRDCSACNVVQAQCCHLLAALTNRPFHLVFSAEGVFFSIFRHSTRAFENRRYSSGAPCQGSAMNAALARALDRSAPLNAFETVAGFREEKIRFEGEDVYSRITSQIVEYLEKGVRPWTRPWNANTPPAGSPVLYGTTASPIPESMCFPFGCPP
jgi:hypothetical protein